MKPRLLILPLAAAIILALVVYRLQREERQPRARQLPDARQLAPRFELYDQSNQLVKFERYLGRTRIVLVFFAADADVDPLLMPLVEHHSRLEAAGFQVLGVSTATPYANQQAVERLGGESLFPLLTDIDPNEPIPAPVHQMWGLIDSDTHETQTGLFLIDRDGTVRWDSGRPSPVRDAESVVEELIVGSWPGGD